MALQGTLKDFGIADILQLIGQQQKTGVLYVRGKDQTVQVSFREGNIVRAEASTRRRRELIGSMLVRAEIITEAKLEEALDEQRRTLRRLGDILVDFGLVTRDQFRSMVQLQTTETLHSLFQWKNGTYEFLQEDIDDELETTAPLRAEAILMDGFRIVDEWPVVRKTITGDEQTFQQAKPLPEAAGDNAERSGDFKNIGENERKVFALVSPDRNVRKLIDLSFLGEFETSKALFNLVTLGHLKVVDGGRRASASSSSAPKEGGLERFSPLVAQVATWALMLGLIAFAATRWRSEGAGLAEPADRTYADPALQRYVATQQISRIRAALDVYRLENGSFPAELTELVGAGLLKDRDLHYPWQEPYVYRPLEGAGFVLLPPLR